MSVKNSKLKSALISLAVYSIVFLNACSPARREIAVIPKPESVKFSGGNFKLNENTVIINNSSDSKTQGIIDYFNKFLFDSEGYKLRTEADIERVENTIIFERADSLKDEAYKLKVDENQISLKAESGAGYFYAVQTLLQLMNPKVYSSGMKSGREFEIPCLEIFDFSKFPYRGMHLDVGRHFFPPEFIKKYIDLLAMHKMNRFHWHLTEDQGWRIEIKKYPKLTQIGSVRSETMGDGKPYGGFYTQEEIRDIVEYASERFVTIIPEIEMPGHSMAALSAYPEYSCTGGPFEPAAEWGVFPDIYCAGKEKTFKFLEDVLDEVTALFPSEYIHIGGDEAPKARWKQCPDCQRRIKREGLKDESELQSYFIKRIEKYLNSKGRRIIGWDEILEGGLAPEATVMSWRGVKGGIEAAKQNHNVIMTPGTHCYFDHYQFDPKNEPEAIGGFLPLSKVYSYNPVPDELNADEAEYILGAQGNVWTEYMPDSKQVEYMAIPRMDALAEVVWSGTSDSDFQDFAYRLKTQFARYDFLKVNYSKSLYKISIIPEFIDSLGKVRVSLRSELDSNSIYYTLDGSVVDENSRKYDEPFPLERSAVVKAALVKKGIPEIITEDEFDFNYAFDKNIIFENKLDSSGVEGNPKILVDGIRGSKNIRTKKWLKIKKKDLDVLIDLGENKEVHFISAGFIQREISRVFLPQKVAFFISSGGSNFEKLGELTNNISPRDGRIITHDFEFKSEKKSARYVRIKAENIGVCPEWHRSSGGDAWLFADEIKVK